MYFLGTTRQLSEYKSKMSFIINHLKKEFEHGNYIASALNRLKVFEVRELKPEL
jgi:hypothetical protein